MRIYLIFAMDDFLCEQPRWRRDDSNETGLHGLCKADHMVFLTARGGIYTDSPMEQGARYLEQMAAFFGIAKFDCVAAEGLDIGAWPVVELMEQAKEKAAEVAKAF